MSNNRRITENSTIIQHLQKLNLHTHKNVQKQCIQWIYEQTKNNISINEILE
jgi:hypothetical protein